MRDFKGVIRKDSNGFHFSGNPADRAFVRRQVDCRRRRSVSTPAACPERSRFADIAGPPLGIRGLVNIGFVLKNSLRGTPAPIIVLHAMSQPLYAEFRDCGWHIGTDGAISFRFRIVLGNSPEFYFCELP